MTDDRPVGETTLEEARRIADHQIEEARRAEEQSANLLRILLTSAGILISVASILITIYISSGGSQAIVNGTVSLTFLREGTAEIPYLTPEQGFLIGISVSAGWIRYSNSTFTNAKQATSAALDAMKASQFDPSSGEANIKDSLDHPSKYNLETFADRYLDRISENRESLQEKLESRREAHRKAAKAGRSLFLTLHLSLILWSQNGIYILFGAIMLLYTTYRWIQQNVPQRVRSSLLDFEPRVDPLASLPVIFGYVYSQNTSVDPTSTLWIIFSIGIIGAVITGLGFSLRVNPLRQVYLTARSLVLLLAFFVVFMFVYYGGDFEITSNLGSMILVGVAIGVTILASTYLIAFVALLTYESSIEIYESLHTVLSKYLPIDL